MFSLVVCILVFCAIAIRQIGPWHVPMWLSMSLGAVVVLLFGKISLAAAWIAIDWQVIFYLGGAFVIADSLAHSQILTVATRNYLHNKHSVFALFCVLILAAALVSALLMNDAAALLFAPILLQVAKDLKQPSEPWLLALCFAVTIASVCSPVGNPQNLLIAIQSGVAQPFAVFIKTLLLPSLINLLVLLAVACGCD